VWPCSPARTTEKNLTDFARANNLAMKPVVFEKVEAATGAYFAGRCQAYTTDASGLARCATRKRRIRMITSSFRHSFRRNR